MAAIGLVIAAIPSIIKAIQGISQGQQSKKYADEQRPAYEIPEELKQMLASARDQAAMTKLPGQSLAEENIRAATSKALTASKEATDSPVNILGAASQLAKQEQESMRGLAGLQAENWAANQANLREQLGLMGAEKQKQWMWEKQLPYEESMATAAALQEAGGENLMSGLSDLAGMAYGAYTNKQYLDAMGSMNADRTKALLEYLNNQKTNVYGDASKISPTTTTPTITMGGLQESGANFDLIPNATNISDVYKFNNATGTGLNMESILGGTNTELPAIQSTFNPNSSPLLDQNTLDAMLNLYDRPMDLYKKEKLLNAAKSGFGGYGGGNTSFINSYLSGYKF